MQPASVVCTDVAKKLNAGGSRSASLRTSSLPGLRFATVGSESVFVIIERAAELTCLILRVKAWSACIILRGKAWSASC